MPTDAQTDLHAFYDFLGLQIQKGAALSPEASVEAYRAYERDLARLQKELQPAIDAFHRGEGRILDPDRIKREVTERLKDEGIVE